MKTLKNIYSFDEYVNEAALQAPIGGKPENYMVFGNLKSIKKNVETLLAMDPNKMDEILKNGHDWAEDHISVANENLDQVTHFFTNTTESTVNENATKEEKMRREKEAEAKMKENMAKLYTKLKEKPEDADVTKAEIDLLQAKQTVMKLQKAVTNIKERKARETKFS
jgi:hypothetical protein